MSINPQNYLLALILWHLIMCCVFTLQHPLWRACGLLQNPGLSTNQVSLLICLNWVPSRKSLSQGKREDAQVAWEQFCQANPAPLWPRHANLPLLATTLLSQPAPAQPACTRHLFPRAWFSGLWAVGTTLSRATHKTALTHRLFFYHASTSFNKWVFGERFFPPSGTASKATGRDGHQLCRSWQQASSTLGLQLLLPSQLERIQTIKYLTGYWQSVTIHI